MTLTDADTISPNFLESHAPVEYRHHSKSSVSLKHNKSAGLGVQNKGKSRKENMDPQFPKDAALEKIRHLQLQLI